MQSQWNFMPMQDGRWGSSDPAMHMKALSNDWLRVRDVGSFTRHARGSLWAQHPDVGARPRKLTSSLSSDPFQCTSCICVLLNMASKSLRYGQQASRSQNEHVSAETKAPKRLSIQGIQVVRSVAILLQAKAETLRLSQSFSNFSQGQHTGLSPKAGATAAIPPISTGESSCVPKHDGYIVGMRSIFAMYMRASMQHSSDWTILYVSTG